MSGPTGSRLDPDVQAIADAMRAAGVPPLHVRGVSGARELMRNLPQVPGPRMHQVEDLSFAGPHGEVPVRVYRPFESHGAPSPAIVYFHGGGMLMGDLDSYDNLTRHFAAATECTVLSIDYRLAPEHVYPVATDEAYAAVAWTCEHAEQLGLDRDRVAVAGDSAGGSLAAGAALQARDRGGPRIRAQFLFYPGIERDQGRPSTVEFGDGPFLYRADITWMKDMYLGPDPSRDTAYGVPSIASDLRDLPDAVVVTGEADPIRDAVEAFGARLRDARVPTILIRYPGVSHGFLSLVETVGRAQVAMREIGALARAKMQGKAE